MTSQNPRAVSLFARRNLKRNSESGGEMGIDSRFEMTPRIAAAVQRPFTVNEMRMRIRRGKQQLRPRLHKL